MPFHHYKWTTPWSVGALLEQKWPMGYVPPEALERGSQVHSIIEAIDTGSLAPTPPPHLQGYVDAWKKFTYALAPSWDKIEYFTGSWTAWEPLEHKACEPLLMRRLGRCHPR